MFALTDMAQNMKNSLTSVDICASYSMQDLSYENALT